MNTYGIEEAAEIARVHPHTLRKMAAAGQVPATKIGRAWIFPVHLFDAWIENKCLSTNGPAPTTGGAKVQSLATRIARQREQRIAKMQKSSSTGSATGSGGSTS